MKQPVDALTRTIAAALVALLVVAGCGQHDVESSAEAARADSSAAGYTVGERTDSDGGAGDTARRVAVAGTPNGGQPAPLSTAIPARGRSALSSVRAGVGTGKPKSGALPVDTIQVAGSATAPLPDAGRALPRVGSVATVRAPAGPVRVNEFLTYDERSRTVSLQLIAGYNGLNGSLNYNGSTNGNHGISVPMGWRIHVSVANRDSDLQHSAIVVSEMLPPPIEPVNPAFTGAALPQLDEGLHEDETGTIDFVADRAGRFMIACGVAGHAQAGMWLQLTVVQDATAPLYR